MIRFLFATGILFLISGLIFLILAISAWLKGAPDAMMQFVVAGIFLIAGLGLVRSGREDKGPVKPFFEWGGWPSHEKTPAGAPETPQADPVKPAKKPPPPESEAEAFERARQGHGMPELPGDLDRKACSHEAIMAKLAEWGLPHELVTEEAVNQRDDLDPWIALPIYYNVIRDGEQTDFKYTWFMALDTGGQIDMERFFELTRTAHRRFANEEELKNLLSIKGHDFTPLAALNDRAGLFDCSPWLEAPEKIAIPCLKKGARVIMKPKHISVFVQKAHKDLGVKLPH